MDAPLGVPGAILFDLDDTILDDSSGVEPAWRAVCGEAAAELPGLDAESLFEAIGRHRDWYWSDPRRHRQGRLDLRATSARIVERALTELGFRDPDLARATANRYRDRREAAVRPFPGAVETLAGWRAMGVRLALVTNGSGASQRAKIERFDLARLFDRIIIEGEFGRGKPDQRVYAAALDGVEADAASSWSVGDNLEWDVAAPQRLGLRGVWVDRRAAGLPDGTPVRPDRIVGSITELAPQKG